MLDEADALNPQQHQQQAPASSSGSGPAQNPTGTGSGGRRDSLGYPWRDGIDFHDLYDKTRGVRVRQHVNPFKPELQRPPEPVDWSRIYSDPTLPLQLDIGCGSGRFLLNCAETAAGDCNYLGLDIREKLIERAQFWAGQLGLAGRLHYRVANASLWLRSLLDTYPGQLALASVQFPDPHFKNRHKKRRIVQPTLVSQLVGLLPPGSCLFLQSDVEEVAASMRNEFELGARDSFELSPEHGVEGATFPVSPDMRWLTLGGKPAKAGEVPGGNSVLSSAESEEDSGETELSSLAESAQEEAAENGFEAACSDAMLSSAESEEGVQEEAGSRADDLADEREEAAGIRESEWARAGWLKENPLGTPTEREHQTLRKGLPVHRILLVRR